MIREALLTALILPAALTCHAQAPFGNPAPSHIPVQSRLGALPLTFEINRGQASGQVRFLSRSAGYNTFLTAEGMTVALRPLSVSSSSIAKVAGNARILQFKLNGSSQNPVIVGEDLQPGRVNYFIGNNSAKWHTNIPTYGKVRYKNVYPGIDLVYYGTHRHLEYDFEMTAGADPNQIDFEIKGASHIDLDQQNNLVVRVGRDRLTFANPTIYEVVEGNHIPLAGTYAIKDSTHVGFRVPQHDPSRLLVIDPVLVYSTYLGGNGDDEAKAIAVDTAGSVYVAGYTDSADFPLATLGSLPAGSPHVFVAKLDPTGSTLLYADFIGGKNQDYGYAMTLDSSDNVVVTGTTTSSDFPVVNAYQAIYPGSSNAFLAKLSRDGSSLLYSTYLGGNGSDIPSSVAVDSNNQVVVAGYTSSTNFPTANAYQSTVSANAGGLWGYYGFLTKFVFDGSSLVYSTYLGGSSNVPYNCGGTPCWGEPATTVSGMVLDSTGNAYLGGVTNTYDFPITSGTYQTTNTTQQNADVSFLTKFGPAGNLMYSTYFYESSGLMTDIAAIAVDGTGSVYATGQAMSDGTFPLTTTTICDPAVYGFSCGYGFVSKFDPTGSSLQYSTFLGPNNLASPTSLVLDPSDNAYVLGVTSSNSFATTNAIETYAGGNDLLLAELDPTGATQLWTTYLGGSGNDTGSGLAMDPSLNLYLVGTTTSTDLPVTTAAFQALYAGNTDSIVVKVSPASSAAVTLVPQSLDFASQAIGTTSALQTVLLRNMGSAALTIRSISASSDFAETDTCGSSVQAAGSCSLSVTFSPTAAGQRTGTVQISDDTAGSPHSIALSGFGNGAMVAASPTSVIFSATVLGTSSTTQTVTVSDTGNATLHISGIQAAGDFSQTNNCNALSAGSSCTVTVKFTPTAAGNRSGTLTITDDAASSPQTIALSGTGSDFAVTSSPTSATVNSGAPAIYNLTISPVGSTFNNPVKLACQTLPAVASCAFSSGSVTPGSGKAISTLTINTGSTGAKSAFRTRRSNFVFATWFGLSGIACFGSFFVVSGRGKRRLRAFLLLGSMALITFLTGCAGGTGIAPQGGEIPSGTYTVTVTGTSGALEHSVSLSLVVQ